jgi:hypothetical protein
VRDTLQPLQTVVPLKTRPSPYGIIIYCQHSEEMLLKLSHKKISLLVGRLSGIGLVNVISLSNHKDSIQNSFVFLPKPGIAPALEFVYFIGYQGLDSFSQLFFKEQSVKTHFSEYSFDIVQHGKKLDS